MRIKILLFEATNIEKIVHNFWLFDYFVSSNLKIPNLRIFNRGIFTNCWCVKRSYNCLSGRVIQHEPDFLDKRYKIQSDKKTKHAIQVHILCNRIGCKNRRKKMEKKKKKKRMKLKTKNKIAKNKKKKRNAKIQCCRNKNRKASKTKIFWNTILDFEVILFKKKKKRISPFFFRILSRNFLANKLSNLLESGEDLVIFPPVTEKCNLMVYYKFLYTSLRLVQSRVVQRSVPVSLVLGIHVYTR